MRSSYPAVSVSVAALGVLRLAPRHAPARLGVYWSPYACQRPDTRAPAEPIAVVRPFDADIVYYTNLCSRNLDLGGLITTPFCCLLPAPSPPSARRPPPATAARCLQPPPAACRHPRSPSARTAWPTATPAARRPRALCPPCVSSSGFFTGNFYAYMFIEMSIGTNRPAPR